MKKDTNYYRAKGSYSRPGKEAKKAAKFYESEPLAQIGTDEIVNRYTSATPGQDTNWRSVKEEIDGESKPKPKKQYVQDPNKGADRKPIMTNVNGKKVVRMAPVEREIVKEAKMKLRSQNDVRAMLFDFVSEYIDKESMPNLMKLAKLIGKKLTKTGNSFMVESVLNEKTLTPAELKKREEIAKSIERDNPNMPMDKKMAIATAAAKRVAEMNFHSFRNQLLEEKKECSHCEGKGYHMEDGKKMECPECNGTGMMKESVEQLDELSPATHKSYQAKAFTDGARAMAKKRMGTMSTKDAYEKEKKRHAGIDTSKHLNRMHHGVKEEVELDESVAKAYKIMKPTKSMNHGIEAIKKHMKVDHGTATNLAKQVMDKVKKGEFKEGLEENMSAPQSAAHRRAQLPKTVKLKGFGPDSAKGNMGDSTARASLKPKKPTNEGMDNPPFTPDPKKPAMKNSDGTTTKPMSRAKQLAQKAIKKKTMGEAKSFDQKFKDHLKFATSDSPAVKSYMAKKQDQRRARNAKMDPGADKKGLAISVIDRQKAYAKGKKKGIGVMDIDTRPGKDHATGKSGGKLPK